MKFSTVIFTTALLSVQANNTMTNNLRGRRVLARNSDGRKLSDESTLSISSEDSVPSVSSGDRRKLSESGESTPSEDSGDSVSSDDRRKLSESGESTPSTPSEDSVSSDDRRKL